jgi:acetyl esterase/lipase
MMALVSLPVLVVCGLLLRPALVAADDKKPAPLTGGNFEVQVIKDVAYNDAKDAHKVKHKLDLYLPKGKKDFPVLLFVHGGGWRNGDKRIYGLLGKNFAKNGVGVVITNYRLTTKDSKVKHPDHIRDVAKAFAWTHKNIGKHGGKASEIFIAGHSAGGHLVALLATDPSYLQAEKLSLSDIKGVIALSGVYVIRPVRNLGEVFSKDEEECKKASPQEHVKGKHPPFLIAYGDKESKGLGRQAKPFGKALKDCKCEAEVLEIADRDHVGIMRRAVMSDEDPLSQAMLKFIAKHSGLKLTPKAAKTSE